MIWERLKNGEIDALGALYDEHVDKLYQYGKSLCSDNDVVKDCIHDLFLDLYKYRNNLSTPANVEYYLLKSLKNKILKDSKSNVVAVDFDENLNMQRAELVGNSIEDSMIQHEVYVEKHSKLTFAMNALTKQQRRGINLRFVEDKSYQDIAEMLNVSIESARTIVYRGIKLLRQNMLLVLIAELMGLG